MVIDILDWVLARASGRPTQEEARRDPWRRLEALEPPVRAFGPGAEVDFRAYLTTDTRVSPTTPEQMAAWLTTCRYVSDADLLGEHDAWLHPTTMELLRSGDCEDFALWGWQKLVAARYDATFVVGVRRRVDGASERHAWVTYRDPVGEFVFDGVERTVDRIIRPLPSVWREYEPQVGVAADGNRFAFAGLFLSDWGRRMTLRRVARGRGGVA